MSADVIPFPTRADRPRLVAIPRIEIEPVQLDPQAWGFPDREAMERAWAEEDARTAAAHVRRRQPVIGNDDGPEAA